MVAQHGHTVAPLGISFDACGFAVLSNNSTNAIATVVGQGRVTPVFI